ncbi:hypothetical protein GCM10020331_022060 [Ectobacillus funiculus]
MPTSLLISVASSREAVPFPALVEALMMEVTFEALREAGVRLPKQVGAAVSIVGALVIGQAAVQAGLVSAPMVIVVAITGVASFMVPHYTQGIALRMLRFPMIFARRIARFTWGYAWGDYDCRSLMHIAFLRDSIPYTYRSDERE